MIDTVHYTTCRRLSPEVLAALNNPSRRKFDDWIFKISDTMSDAQMHDGSIVKFRGQHLGNGCAIFVNHGKIEKVFASLPRVWAGSNGAQITNQRDLEEAQRILNGGLGGISTIQGDPVEKLSRLDLAFNLHSDNPEALVEALSRSTHPQVRNEATGFINGNIQFQGTDLTFTAYWKRRAQKSIPTAPAWEFPSTLRMELQIKNSRAIRTRFGGDLQFGKIPLWQCYKVFRDFMLGFPCVQRFSGVLTREALVALCEARGVDVNGQKVLDVYIGQLKNKQNKARARRKVAAYKAHFANVDWGELFPADRLPATHTILANGSVQFNPAASLSADSAFETHPS